MGIETFELENYIVEMIDNPLRLDHSKKTSLLEQCISVARNGFKNENITKSDIETHALDVKTGIYIRNKKELIGFGGAIIENINGNNILHLKGTAILPAHQGKKIYRIITSMRVLREAEKSNDFYIGSRTQNPRVLEFMTKTLEGWPRVNEQIPDKIKNIAYHYANHIQNNHSDFIPEKGIVFNRDLLVVEKAYGFRDENGIEQGFCMYGNSVPNAKDQRINSHITSNLNFQNGDAFIILGDFNKEVYLKSLENIPELDKDKILFKRFSN